MIVSVPADGLPQVRVAAGPPCRTPLLDQVQPVDQGRRQPAAAVPGGSR